MLGDVMQNRDDQYPIKPVSEQLLFLDADGRLNLPEMVTGNVFLRLQYQAIGREPHVSVSADNGKCVQQFFEPKQKGLRYLNLSGLSTGVQELVITQKDCEIKKQTTLLQFPDTSFTDGPILIVAPHADDAELAAYGFYRKHADRCWIVTVSAGEKLQSIKRQYVPGLDENLSQAETRKGLIRAWNSVTTPLLAGVSSERLVMLGYSNMTLSRMLENPDAVIENHQDQLVHPGLFRRFNRVVLPKDSSVQNRGNDLISDLVSLIEQIRPATIVVTHPELDPHPDHIATAKAVSIALSQANFVPERVLLYANHFRDAKYFPFGPEYAGAALPPAQMNQSVFGEWQIHCEHLSIDIQKEKVIALDTMHDLRHKLRLERRLKQWWAQCWRKNKYQYYGAHPYFQTAIKAHEVFVVVSGKAFVRGLT